MLPALTLSNSTFGPHYAINMFFAFLKKEQRYFPLCNFKIPVSITETESAFCSVRAEPFKYNSKGRTYRGSRIWLLASHCRCLVSILSHFMWDLWVHSGTMTGFLRVLLFPLSVSFILLVPERQRAKPGKLPNRSVLSEIAYHWLEYCLHLTFKGVKMCNDILSCFRITSCRLL